MLPIKVPPLGESIVEATVSRWQKKEGDAVAAGDTLVELETDKITVEVPALKPGVLAKQAKKKKATLCTSTTYSANSMRVRCLPHQAPLRHQRPLQSLRPRTLRLRLFRRRLRRRPRAHRLRSLKRSPLRRRVGLPTSAGSTSLQCRAQVAAE